MKLVGASLTAHGRGRADVAVDVRNADGLISAEKAEKSLAEAKASATDIIKEARVQANKIVEQANRHGVDPLLMLAIQVIQQIQKDAGSW